MNLRRLSHPLHGVAYRAYGELSVVEPYIYLQGIIRLQSQRPHVGDRQRRNMRQRMVRGDGTYVYQDGANADCAREGVRDGRARGGLVNYLAPRNGYHVYIPDVDF